MREWIARLRDWMRRDELDAELREELAFHRAHLERDERDANDVSAATVARRRLGNVTVVMEASRERWSIPWLDHLRRDARHAVRGLRRAPGFAATVILVLAFGIGANAATFGVVDRLMFRPYPMMRDPARVQRIYQHIGSRWSVGTSAIMPYTRYLDFRRWTHHYTDIAAFTIVNRGVGMGVEVRERRVMAASASFFSFFDARPSSGRWFTAAEDATPVGASVAVLDHGYWETALGGRDVIGRAIQIGDAQYTIIGVAPRGFVGVSDGEAPSVYVPITAYAVNDAGGDDARSYFTRYSWDVVEIMARVAPGITHEAASADLHDAFVRSWSAARVQHPDYPTARELNADATLGALKMAAGPDPGLEARTLLWVSGVALIVLLIACANVMNLFLARAIRRRREVALRRALGVSRARLVTQALTETVVLSLLGCGLGIAIAQWGGIALRRLFIADTGAFDVVDDWRTLLVAVGAALVAALATGVAPVMFASGDDIVTTLKSGAREGTYRRSTLRTALLVVQASLSVALLVGAGLFVRSLSAVQELHLGYDIDRVLLARWERAGTVLDSVQQAALRERLIAAARATNGVESAAWVNSPPFDRGTTTLNLSVSGVDSIRRFGRFTRQFASADYFATAGTRIVRGRGFLATDRVGAPGVVVVSRAMADALWPRGNAVGQCIHVAMRSMRPDTMPCTSVVGVAENVVHDPATDLPMRYYLPDAQYDLGSMAWLLVRTRGAPALVTEPLRAAMQAALPGRAFVSVKPASEMFDAKRRSWLVGATLLVGLGALALVVAAIGLYGVIAYHVAERMHELGVRAALGARGGDIVRLIASHGLRLALVGVVVGSAAALALAPFIQPLLFRESARDPLVFASVAALIAAVALLACGVPALRASRADPMTVLREE